MSADGSPSLLLDSPAIERLAVVTIADVLVRIEADARLTEKKKGEMRSALNVTCRTGRASESHTGGAAAAPPQAGEADAGHGGREAQDLGQHQKPHTQSAQARRPQIHGGTQQGATVAQLGGASFAPTRQTLAERPLPLHELLLGRRDRARGRHCGHLLRLRDGGGRLQLRAGPRRPLPRHLQAMEQSR
jgi:hypothetical protein